MQTGSKLLAIAALIALPLAGCSAPVLTPTPTATQTVEPEPEPVFIPAPLTGVLYAEEDAAHLALPAVLGKVDNTWGVDHSLR